MHDPSRHVEHEHEARCWAQPAEQPEVQSLEPHQGSGWRKHGVIDVSVEDDETTEATMPQGLEIASPDDQGAERDLEHNARLAGDGLTTCPQPHVHASHRKVERRLDAPGQGGLACPVRTEYRNP